MNKTRRTLLTAAGAAAMLGLAACGNGEAESGEYPSDNVDIIVPYDAGGNVDTQARALSQCLENTWDQRVLVENRPGSAGTIGTREVANADPDGYTLSIGSVSPSVLGPRLLDNAGYETDDLRYFGYVTAAPILFFVDGDSEYDSLEEVVDAARNGTVTASSPGVDSLQALLAQQFNNEEGTNFNIVPTDSTNEIVRGVQAGDYDVGITATSLDLLPRIDSGDIKLLARGGDETYEHFEGVETFDEAGYGDLLPYTDITIPLVGPAEISDDVADEIETALADCLADDSVAETIGVELVPNSHVDGAQVTEEYAELGEAIDQMETN